MFCASALLASRTYTSETEMGEQRPTNILKVKSGVWVKQTLHFDKASRLFHSGIEILVSMTILNLTLYPAYLHINVTIKPFISCFMYLSVVDVVKHFLHIIRNFLRMCKLYMLNRCHWSIVLPCT
jgi:hypothetical protein